METIANEEGGGEEEKHKEICCERIPHERMLGGWVSESGSPTLRDTSCTQSVDTFNWYRKFVPRRHENDLNTSIKLPTRASTNWIRANASHWSDYVLPNFAGHRILAHFHYLVLVLCLARFSDSLGTIYSTVGRPFVIRDTHRKHDSQYFINFLESKFIRVDFCFRRNRSVCRSNEFLPPHVSVPADLRRR